MSLTGAAFEDGFVVYMVLAGAVVGTLLGVGVWLRSKRSRPPLAVAPDGWERLLALLGGADNVLSAHAEGGRASFQLRDLAAADLEGIRAFGATGIFVAGSTVKALFPFDASVLTEQLRRKG